MKKYKYYDGTQSSQYRDKVEIDLGNDICVVDIPSYLNGRRIFPCGSGNNCKICRTDIIEINKIIRQKSGLSDITQPALQRMRVRIETCMRTSINEFYDWKDCLDYCISQLNIPDTALKFLYPTTEEYLSIPQLLNLNS